MLQGSSLEKAARDITSAAALSWKELQPVLADGCAQGLIPRDLLSREAFTWSFSTLLSRLVKLPGSGGVDTLVPWADMLNHSPSVSAFFEYDAGSRSVVLRSDKAYKRGEQVQALLVKSMSPPLITCARNALQLRCRYYTCERLSVECHGRGRESSAEDRSCLCRCTSRTVRRQAASSC